MRALPFVVALLIAAPSARAQEATATASAFGLGAQTTISGLGGPTLVYQTPRFHIEGLLDFHDDGSTAFAVAGRFWWVLHGTANSDFSLGGGLGFQNVD